jgi:chloramphenicol O-acetyltransferase type A
MRQINLETWPRREHFKVFSGLGYPHFGLSANVDITTFRPFLKRRDISFTVAIVYALARAANGIPEFRYRIRDGNVVEHEVCHPSTTILTGEDLFSFCTFRYSEDFSSFAAEASTRIAHVKEHLTMYDGTAYDELLFMMGIPWVSFTGFIHPINLDPVDSVPRFAWGRFFEEGDSLKMPMNVQAHHALVDGIHVGRFYQTVQEYLNDPDHVLG